MFQTVSYYGFVDAFRGAGRGDQFSCKALEALWEYLEQLESDCGTPIELDVVGLCCDYTEYDDLEDAWSQTVGGDYPGEAEVLEYFQDRTTVLPVTGGGVILGAF
jgi:hypothetical protein